jgi:hypothetical protein
VRAIAPRATEQMKFILEQDIPGVASERRLTDRFATDFDEVTRFGHELVALFGVAVERQTSEENLLVSATETVGTTTEHLEFDEINPMCPTTSETANSQGTVRITRTPVVPASLSESFTCLFRREERVATHTDASLDFTETREREFNALGQLTSSSKQAGSETLVRTRRDRS